MKFKTVAKLRDFNKDYQPNKLRFPRICTIKYDGRHTTIFKKVNGDVEYYSSSGKMFKLLDDQVFGFDDTPVGVYFAEMMGEGVEGKLGDRVHSGIQTTMFTNTKKGILNKHKPTWRIFDFVTFEDYEKGESALGFVDRFSYLMEHIPTQYLAYNMESLELAHDEMFLNKVVEAGYEGIVSIDFDHRWAATKSRKWTAIKWKKRPTADLLCTGTTEGEGKYEGQIGALLLVDSMGRSVSVGSGLSDSDRAMDSEEFVGKVVEIEYEQITNCSYIQPTFVRVREDKRVEEID